MHARTLPWLASRCSEYSHSTRTLARVRAARACRPPRIARAGILCTAYRAARLRTAAFPAAALPRCCGVAGASGRSGEPRPLCVIDLLSAQLNGLSPFADPSDVLLRIQALSRFSGARRRGRPIGGAGVLTYGVLTGYSRVCVVRPAAAHCCDVDAQRCA